MKQKLPKGGMISSSGIIRFENVNKDTIWGSGGYIQYPNNQYRGIIYRTINGGENWLFQIPDTSIDISIYSFCEFENKRTGWLYNSMGYGVHTTTGGNDTFYTGVQQISGRVPKDFKLYQNYPNPFNPRTNIRYEIRSQMSEVRLLVFDVNGKEVSVLVNKEQGAGTYEVDFSGNGLSSGVYFYQLTVKNTKGGEVYRETRKAILLK
jgi:hypothetical protein